MKVSEWLRTYQIAGQPPEIDNPPEIAFWCGFLIGMGSRSSTAVSIPEKLEIAIKCAEFIEAQ
jgi:hypothetical protein